jgi:hypothetical protein
MNIPNHISESIQTIFLLKILDADPEIRNLFDPGSGILDGKIRIRVLNIPDHP